MGELKVRRIDPVVLKKIDDLAREKNISREECVRRYLSRLAVMEEAEQIEEKYTSLVHTLADRLEQANDIIELNNMLLEKIEKKLERS